MKKLRWGVIGAGGIADRRTIPGMMLAENAELIAVMDINAEQVEKIRQKYGAKRGYTKEEDLLADPEVDAVYIATPIVLHAKQAKLAADYGKDILIEKPLAMTSDEGQAVIDYCERKGVKIAAGFMMRFGSHVMSMKKAIAEGKIGTVVSGYSQFTLWLPYEPGNWRQCKAKAGGGAMMDLSVHTIDLMEYITGMRVTEVASMNEKIAFPEPQYDVEDTSTILMRMENGAQCVVQSNFNIPDEASKWRVEFFGTKGRLLGDTMIGQIDGGKLKLTKMSPIPPSRPTPTMWASRFPATSAICTPARSRASRTPFSTISPSSCLRPTPCTSSASWKRPMPAAKS